MNNTGFTLLEFLVSLFIVSYGITSLLHFQNRSLYHYKQDVSFATALQLSHDLFERIRANPQAVSVYQQYIQSPPSQVTCENSYCTAEQFAQYDMWHWHELKKSHDHLYYHSKICLEQSGERFNLQWDWSFDNSQTLDCEQALLNKELYLF